MMRTVFLSIAGILLHLDAAGRSVFKKRDDFEPTGRFWTSLYTLILCPGCPSVGISAVYRHPSLGR